MLRMGRLFCIWAIMWEALDEEGKDKVDSIDKEGLMDKEGSTD